MKRWWYPVRKLPDYHIRRIASACGHIERTYHRKFGRKPEFSAPRTFNEKLGWIKRHFYDPVYTRMADKVAVRDFVRERAGEDLLVPCYGVWDRADDIPFAALPEAFVLKCNHESGFAIICREKSRLDIHLARAMLKTRLKMNYYYRFLEWPYRDITPRIIAEELLRDGGGREPMEYKISCFNGEPRFILAEQFNRHRYLRCFYSPSWEQTPFTIRIPNTVDSLPRPVNLQRMLETAAALARDLLYCRVDLFSVDDRLYFNEMTIFPSAGLGPFLPESYDLYWGEQLVLPHERKPAPL